MSEWSLRGEQKKCCVYWLFCLEHNWRGKKLFDPGNETEFGIWIHEIAFNICRGLIYIPSLRERDRFETSDSEARNSEIDGIRGFLFSRYTFIGFFSFFFIAKIYFNISIPHVAAVY